MDRRLFLDHLDLFARSRMTLIGYYSLMPNLEGDLPEILAAIRETGCKTALDCAGSGGSMQPLDRILPHLDVYVPSLNEASHQTGLNDPRAILDLYRGCGAAGLVGVKLGSKGVLLSPAAGEYVEIPAVAPPGPIVDTTGAGDCFYAGLLDGAAARTGRSQCRAVGRRGRGLLHHGPGGHGRHSRFRRHGQVGGADFPIARRHGIVFIACSRPGTPDPPPLPTDAQKFSQ